MTKKVLMIGRYQPLHKGHKTLVQNELNQGHEVIVALRDTDLSEKNPYTVLQRAGMFNEAFGHKIKVVSIPDFDEIVYGRGVGYSFREESLPPEIEAISATKIRAKQNRVIWLTGQSGAGKTTLALALCKAIGALNLDGDEMRESISLGAGFSLEERFNHNMRVARAAKVFSKQTTVVVSVIAPTDAIRDGVTAICDPFWVHIKRDLPSTKDRPYSPPRNPDLVIDVDSMTVEAEVIAVRRSIQ